MLCLAPDGSLFACSHEKAALWEYDPEFGTIRIPQGGRIVETPAAIRYFISASGTVYRINVEKIKGCKPTAE